MLAVQLVRFFSASPSSSTQLGHGTTEIVLPRSKDHEKTIVLSESVRLLETFLACEPAGDSLVTMKSLVRGLNPIE